MVRRILGNRVVDFLKQFTVLKRCYEFIVHQFRHTLPRLFKSSSYRYWVRHIEAYQAPSELSLKPEVVVCIKASNFSLVQLQKCILSLEEQSLLPSKVCIIFEDNTLDASATLSVSFPVEYTTAEQALTHVPQLMVLVAEPASLHRTALWEFSAALQSDSIVLAYSDHDELANLRKRRHPYFKSAFNEFMLRQVNYFGAVCALTPTHRVAAKIARAVISGEPLDCAVVAQLEIEPGLKPGIVHIDRVLFHQHRKSLDELKQSAISQRDTRLAIQAKALEPVKNDTLDIYNLRYRPTEHPLVSILVPTRDHYEDLKLCVESVLEKTEYPHFEIIVVDNGSTCRDTLNLFDSLEQIDNVRVVRYDLPFNYSKINNYAARLAQGEILVLLNNDTEVISPRWLCDMVALLENPTVGCVGAKLLYHDGSIQHAGVAIGPGGYAGHSHRFVEPHQSGYFYWPHLTHSVSAVTAACLAVRTDRFWEVDGLDEAFRVAYNDVDFCLKLVDAGYQNVYCATAELYHYESKSRGKDDTPEKQARFAGEKARLVEKWSALIAHDPMYSQHLTRNGEDFSVRTGY